MSKKTVIIICFLVFLFILLSIITFVMAKNTKNMNDYNEEKINSQIGYIDYQIIKILNEFDNYSNHSFTETENINWNQLETEIHELYVSWNVVIVDFSNLNIDNHYLINFGKKLDEIMIDIQNKETDKTLEDISELYYFLTKYTEYYNAEILFKNNIDTKYYLIKSYALLYTNNWTIISENINNAAKSFYSNINMVEIAENQKFNLNKTYVAINELKNTVANKNKELFYIKYKIAMEEIGKIN